MYGSVILLSPEWQFRNISYIPPEAVFISHYCEATSCKLYCAFPPWILIKGELCKSHCFVPELKQRGNTQERCSLSLQNALFSDLGGKRLDSPSHNCGWYLILLGTKLILPLCRSTIELRLTFRVISQTGSPRLTLGLPGPLLTWTKRIWRKSHFFPFATKHS